MHQVVEIRIHPFRAARQVHNQGALLRGDGLHGTVKFLHHMAKIETVYAAAIKEVLACMAFDSSGRGTGVPRRLGNENRNRAGLPGQVGKQSQAGGIGIHPGRHEIVAALQRLSHPFELVELHTLVPDLRHHQRLVDALQRLQEVPGGAVVADALPDGRASALGHVPVEAVGGILVVVVQADVVKDVLRRQARDVREPPSEIREVAEAGLPVDARVGDGHGQPGLGEAPLQRVLPGFAVADVALVSRAAADRKDADIGRAAIAAAQAVAVAGVGDERLVRLVQRRNVVLVDTVL